MELRERQGWGDIYSINGLDPSGIGCILTIGTREYEFSATKSEVETYARMASHLAAAYRCRRRLGVSTGGALNDRKSDTTIYNAEAILDAKGHFVHADGAAAPKAARQRIRESMTAIEHLRAKGERAGRAALEIWRPLTAARWTLVDTFEENG
jgi:hypothetical protein